MLDQATRLREIAEQKCSRSHPTKPHVITIASGKGGVGKSTVALNLALRLADLGSNTILLDADENLGNIDVMAGISPRLRLGDVLRGEKDIEEVIVSPSKNFSILPGNSGDSGYPIMTMEKQTELLNDIADLEQRFDYLVIDTSAGIGQDIINFAVHSHETLIVTNPEPTALMDAYALIKMITLADALAPLKIIVNAARTPGEADETAAKLQMAVKHFLQKHVHYLGSIPYDTSVAKAVSRYRPVIKEYPVSGASLSIHMLAGRLVEQTANRNARRFQIA